jgi:(p)ppGpp synthase/HD superfamily hydrolase
VIAHTFAISMIAVVKTDKNMSTDLFRKYLDLLEANSHDALQFATDAHANQTRAGGDPYITHPMRVADTIKQYKQSHNLDALISAALLHDTVEDTGTTHNDLHELFGGLVASLVKELTSDSDKISQMGKANYLSDKMATMSSWGLVIKLADRLDNVKDITTAKTPEWRAKYKAETEHILDYIEKNRVLSGTHQKIIGLIRAKLNEIPSKL